MPRHRHSFEQIRLPLIGDMNLGEQGILTEGEIGYFPEGGTYGPQDDRWGTPGNCSWYCSSVARPGWGCAPARRGPEAKRPAPSGARIVTKSCRARATTASSNSTSTIQLLAGRGRGGCEAEVLRRLHERAFWIERIRVAAGARWVSTEDNARD